MRDDGTPRVHATAGTRQRDDCTSARGVSIASTPMTSVTEPSSGEHEIDIHTTAGKLADLRRRSEETLHPVGEAAVEKIHAKGKLTARERILALLDEGSFVELDALARHRSTNFGLA